MKVRQIIVSALNIIGRTELALRLSTGAALDAEETDTVNTLLYCFNAVEDEVARNYMPLTCTDDVLSLDEKFYYTTFSFPPVKINRVTADGEDIGYTLYPEYMEVKTRRINVSYEYAPVKKKLDDDSSFREDVGEYLLALGSAAEYCYINGEVEAAGIWEKKYRQEIDGAQRKLPRGGFIPPRRWV